MVKKKEGHCYWCSNDHEPKKAGKNAIWETSWRFVILLFGIMFAVLFFQLSSLGTLFICIETKIVIGHGVPFTLISWHIKSFGFDNGLVFIIIRTTWYSTSSKRINFVTKDVILAIATPVHFLDGRLPFHAIINILICIRHIIPLLFAHFRKYFF